ncbi:MAG: hypothetical protein F6K50_50485 [Moorea sp. SIO3I7]|nr:hypothetical protein [Moorena sp. SIO3I6]NEO03257.1 hypothetical protein [Moorena sp. SIO3I7]NEO07450.1 hypothetical protein [Moorena sp. SIO3I8]NEP25377.1 hypothetical protein [Moorena sp. SIO3I6]
MPLASCLLPLAFQQFRYPNLNAEKLLRSHFFSDRISLHYPSKKNF